MVTCYMLSLVLGVTSVAYIVLTLKKAWKPFEPYFNGEMRWIGDISYIS